MSGESSKKLGKTVRGFWLKVRSSGGAKTGHLVDTTPGCPFGVVVEERLKNMERNIQEVKGRINGLIFLIIGAVAVEIIVRLLV